MIHKSITTENSRKKTYEKEIRPGTILVCRQKYFLGRDGTQRLIIAHGIIHWYPHQKYFKLLALLDDERDMMSCEVEPNRYSESMTATQKAHWYAEWQANALAIRVAMPQELMKQALHEAQDAAAPYHFTGELVEDVLRRVAALFDVPVFAAKQRARQIGFSHADGAFVYVDGKWHEPFWFTECVIAPSETYVIDRRGYERLYANNPDFAELVDSGRFIYIGYVVCINDPKYIIVDFSVVYANSCQAASTR